MNIKQLAKFIVQKWFTTPPNTRIDSYIKSNKNEIKRYKNLIEEEVAEKIESSSLLQELINRNYRFPPECISYLDFLYELIGILAYSNINDAISRDAHYIASQWLKGNYPIFTVDPQLLKLLEHTKLPKIIDFPKIFDFAIFILPKNFITPLHDISVILVNHQDHDIFLGNTLIKKSFSVALLSERFTYLKRLRISENIIEYPDNNLIPNSITMTKEDQEINDKATTTILQLCLLLASMPEAIEEEIIYSLPTKSPGFQPKSQKKTSTCRKPKHIKIPDKIVTRFKYTTDIDIKKSETNPKRKIATHWRIGHWHRFRCGTKKQNFYWKWLPPILINPPIKLENSNKNIKK